MIKRYKQFVKGKTNEEFVFSNPSTVPNPTRPITTPAPAVPKPQPPQILPDTTKSPVPAPAKAELPEEEGGQYVGQNMMTELANALGVNVESDGSINYEGHKINFFSETEMFHIDKKKFKTVEEVLNYIESGNTQTAQPQLRKGTDIIEPEVEQQQAVEDLNKEFESKSYKTSRGYRKFRK